MGVSSRYSANFLAEDASAVSFCFISLSPALSMIVMMTVVRFSDRILAWCWEEKLKSILKSDILPPSLHLIDLSFAETR